MDHVAHLRNSSNQWTHFLRMHWYYLLKLETFSPVDALCQSWLHWLRGLFLFFFIFRQINIPWSSWKSKVRHISYTLNMIRLHDVASLHHYKLLWRRKFLKFVNSVLQFSLSSIGKGCVPSFELTLIPLTQRCFLCQTWL